MTREEAIKNIKEHCYFANLVPKAKEALDLAIKALEQEPRWIPVTERLPEEAFGCFVTVLWTNPKTMEDFETLFPEFVGYDGETWNNADGKPIAFEVVAWMPLPEPYEEDKE